MLVNDLNERSIMENDVDDKELGLGIFPFGSATDHYAQGDTTGAAIRGGIDLAFLGAGSVFKLFGGGGRVLTAEEANALRMAGVRATGRTGEIAVGLTGKRVGIIGPISGKMRFPDGLTKTTISECKNVARQGWTAQLKDYAAIAEERQLTFELWVRGGVNGTILSGPLKAAWDAGKVAIRFF